ncbi:hypothetical protein VaNZ11_007061 [Volvox africanus]|uniref:Uncharacterized protein n=1 Tax=Volvox africanus TaxID=51714 RepID=A0ABQ5S2P1_9CHLO|nr:hypothetical protein VaNZ11_007061 [Volvox africanus]
MGGACGFGGRGGRCTCAGDRCGGRGTAAEQAASHDVNQLPEACRFPREAAKGAPKGTLTEAMAKDGSTKETTAKRCPPYPIGPWDRAPDWAPPPLVGGVTTAHQDQVPLSAPPAVPSPQGQQLSLQQQACYQPSSLLQPPLLSPQQHHYQLSQQQQPWRLPTVVMPSQATQGPSTACSTAHAVLVSSSAPCSASSVPILSLGQLATLTSKDRVAICPSNPDFTSQAPVTSSLPPQQSVQQPQPQHPSEWQPQSAPEIFEIVRTASANTSLQPSCSAGGGAAAAAAAAAVNRATDTATLRNNAATVLTTTLSFPCLHLELPSPLLQQQQQQPAQVHLAHQAQVAAAVHPQRVNAVGGMTEAQHPPAVQAHCQTQRQIPGAQLSEDRSFEVPLSNLSRNPAVAQQPSNMDSRSQASTARTAIATGNGTADGGIGPAGTAKSGAPGGGGGGSTVRQAPGPSADLSLLLHDEVLISSPLAMSHASQVSSRSDASSVPRCYTDLGALAPRHCSGGNGGSGDGSRQRCSGGAAVAAATAVPGVVDTFRCGSLYDQDDGLSRWGWLTDEEEQRAQEREEWGDNGSRKRVSAAAKRPVSARRRVAAGSTAALAGGHAGAKPRQKATATTAAAAAASRTSAGGGGGNLARAIGPAASASVGRDALADAVGFLRSVPSSRVGWGGCGGGGSAGTGAGSIPSCGPLNAQQPQQLFNHQQFHSHTRSQSTAAVHHARGTAAASASSAIAACTNPAWTGRTSMHRRSARAPVSSRFDCSGGASAAATTGGGGVRDATATTPPLKRGGGIRRAVDRRISVLYLSDTSCSSTCESPRTSPWKRRCRRPGASTGGADASVPVPGRRTGGGAAFSSPKGAVVMGTGKMPASQEARRGSGGGSYVSSQQRGTGSPFRQAAAAAFTGASSRRPLLVRGGAPA